MVNVDTKGITLALVSDSAVIPSDTNVVELRKIVRTERSQVEEVFAFWRDVLSTPRSRLDADREKKIRSMLKIGYTVEDLKLAIIGCAFSDWHAGANDRHTKYQDIELICRKAKHVDWFMQKADVEGKRIMRERGEYNARAAEVATPVGRERSAETEAMFKAMLDKLKARKG